MSIRVMAFSGLLEPFTRPTPRRWRLGARRCWPLRPAALLAALPGLLVGLVAAVGYAAVGIAQQAAGQQYAYDLGIFAQAIGNYARLRAPASTLRDIPNVLGDHFSPLLALLAPAWWIHPRPSTLLVVQALCLGVSCLPVWRLLRRHLPGSLGVPILLAYAGFFGFQSLATFGFHEYALAVPLLAFAVERLDAGELPAAVWWVLPLLLVREDLDLLVAVFGVLVAVRPGGRRRGLLLAAGALVWFFATIGVFVPLFAVGSYVYWPSLYGQLGPTPVAFVWHALRAPWWAAARVVLPTVKLNTVLDALLAFGLLPLASSVLWLGVPSLLIRLLAAEPQPWTDGYQYSAILGPVLVAAAAPVAARCACQLGAVLRSPRSGRVLVGLVVVCGALGSSVALGPLPSVVYGLTGGRSVMASCARLMGIVPAGVTVEASDSLATQLLPRDRVYLLDRAAGTATWAVDSWSRGLGAPGRAQRAAAMRARGFRLDVRYPRCDVWRRPRPLSTAVPPYRPADHVGQVRWQ